MEPGSALRDKMEGSMGGKQLHLRCVVSSLQPWSPSLSCSHKKTSQNIPLRFLTPGFSVFICMYVSQQDQWLPSLWPAAWTSSLVPTPSSASHRAGGVTESPTVLISPMKRAVRPWYPGLVLLRSSVPLGSISAQTLSVSRPYCAVTVSPTVPTEKTSTAAVSICVSL